MTSDWQGKHWLLGAGSLIQQFVARAHAQSAEDADKEAPQRHTIKSKTFSGPNMAQGKHENRHPHLSHATELLLEQPSLRPLSPRAHLFHVNTARSYAPAELGYSHSRFLSVLFVSLFLTSSCVVVLLRRRQVPHRCSFRPYTFRISELRRRHSPRRGIIRRWRRSVIADIVTAVGTFMVAMSLVVVVDGADAAAVGAILVGASLAAGR